MTTQSPPTGRVLVKYVLVGRSGTWLAIDDNRREMERLAATGMHVECWVYPVLQNGTHGDPTKRPL